MKILAINGSPRKDGNCHDMLEVLRKSLAKEEIEFEELWVGSAIHPCLACYKCLESDEMRCVQDNDCLNEAVKNVLRRMELYWPVLYITAVLQAILNALSTDCFL